ncbi:hypothetical protein SPRG_18973 [Saprolegnia parasitica CBS 223.65]|uniref:Uncharacterized protein n=1 Tax=Saprolegnia parasitica (strain CBS 223.65) TaxID=695850 RepID=A0A067D4M7_SAPPC|nr:hypothetical protein SPRG_18973 [Saprolegnia parasitica CBS 223.65]KDO33977.1 hypothetical protein SPRG_18973 [Saprolegnia parasitica CBS 223.65]|eukprot:XP_012195189.1 hypothetical protein SPRG_18973 [Saprolegnia parasitica CBS 223.65]
MTRVTLVCNGHEPKSATVDLGALKRDATKIPTLFNLSFPGIEGQEYHIECSDEDKNHGPLAIDNVGDIFASLEGRADITFTARPGGQKGGQLPRHASLIASAAPAGDK